MLRKYTTNWLQSKPAELASDVGFHEAVESDASELIESHAQPLTTKQLAELGNSRGEKSTAMTPQWELHMQGMRVADD